MKTYSEALKIIKNYLEKNGKWKIELCEKIKGKKGRKPCVGCILSKLKTYQKIDCSDTEIILPMLVKLSRKEKLKKLLDTV